MIQPVNFGFNEQTAVNNSFQHPIADMEVQARALVEFDQFVALLKENQLDVTVIKDTPEPCTPDSIFPNNWISFHEDNSIVLYPMFAMNRRLERKQHVLDVVKSKFVVQEVHDLSSLENEHLFLEGTGSMVLDRNNKIAYAALSPRTNPKALLAFCKLMHFTAVDFVSRDINGNDIYHTNVIMCLADKYVVICLECIADAAELDNLMTQFADTNKEVIPITYDQLSHFAGNMLQVRNRDGQLLLIMSSRAYGAFNKEQIIKLESYNRIIHAPLDTIEICGGGSARCMLAEIFNDVK